MQGIKNKLFVLFVLLLLFLSISFQIEAHNNLLDIKYDPCVNYLPGDGDDEVWYYLLRNHQSQIGCYDYFHLSDEIQTIKYYVSSIGRTNPNYTWTTNVSNDVATAIQNAYIKSIKKWNDVYFYTYDNNGNLVSNKIINIVEGTIDDHNLVIYPYYASNSFAARTGPDDSGVDIYTGDANCTHTHFNSWNMDVNIYYFYEHINNSEEEATYNKVTAGSHEMGHVLGLDDIDIWCTENGNHHGEVIMGYQYFGYHTLEITYKDIAGVAITRGFHTDNDHKWMKRLNEDETIDMICSICNGVRYDVELDNGDLTYQGDAFNIYEDTADHDCPHTNMILIATNGDSDFYKCLNCRHIEKREIKKEVTLHCCSENEISSRFCNINVSNESLLYKINVDCSSSYTITSSSNHSLEMTFYDYDMNEISEVVPVMTNSNCTGTINMSLNVGTYYLRINYLNSNDSGTITTIFGATNPSIGIPVSINTNTNMKTHLHPNLNGGYLSRAYFNNTQGVGYFKINLNAGANATYLSGTIKIYTDILRTQLLKRYSVSGIGSNAISGYNENVMYFYLPDNGNYYIDITMPNNDYSILNLRIERTDINNLDYTNSLGVTSFNLLFQNQDTKNCFEEVIISHKSKMQLDVITNNLVTSNIPVYIFKKVLEPGYDQGIEHYYPVLVSNSNWMITNNNSNPLFTIVLDAGTYYIGYAGNTNNVSINFGLRRVVDYDASSLDPLVTDPSINEGFVLGSEVTFNGGLLQGTTITEGFTRCLYLMFEPGVEIPNSRLDYDWYSSNTNVATVSSYGTVLALPVNNNTSVTIYAILREDPSVVYSINLTILNDTSTVPIEIVSNMSYSYSTQNGTYQLALDSSNCPYPWINYYIWDIEIPIEYPNLEVEMNTWGYITSNGIGEATITGNYYINNRIVITINLTINS